MIFLQCAVTQQIIKFVKDSELVMIKKLLQWISTIFSESIEYVYIGYNTSTCTEGNIPYYHMYTSKKMKREREREVRYLSEVV